MIHDPHHTIAALAVRLPCALTLTFADGVTLPVDLSSAVQDSPALAALAVWRHRANIERLKAGTEHRINKSKLSAS